MSFRSCRSPVSSHSYASNRWTKKKLLGDSANGKCGDSWNSTESLITDILSQSTQQLGMNKQRKWANWGWKYPWDTCWVNIRTWKTSIVIDSDGMKPEKNIFQQLDLQPRILAIIMLLDSLLWELEKGRKEKNKIIFRTYILNLPNMTIRSTKSVFDVRFQNEL